MRLSKAPGALPPVCGIALTVVAEIAGFFNAWFWTFHKFSNSLILDFFTLHEHQKAVGALLAVDVVTFIVALLGCSVQRILISLSILFAIFRHSSAFHSWYAQPQCGRCPISIRSFPAVFSSPLSWISIVFDISIILQFSNCHFVLAIAREPFGLHDKNKESRRLHQPSSIFLSIINCQLSIINYQLSITHSPSPQ